MEIKVDKKLSIQWIAQEQIVVPQEVLRHVLLVLLPPIDPAQLVVPHEFVVQEFLVL